MNTPIYNKTSDDMPWPEDKFFYLLTRDGLFKCRNHEFFRSCVPVKGGISELAAQEKFCEVSYPKIPQRLMEVAVGFFQAVADKQNSEAAVIWLWNRQTKLVEMLIPDQIGINSSPSSYAPKGYPMDVKYEIPALPPHLFPIGDMHCHVDGGAYASGTDTNDEIHRPGVHIVVGKIDKEPPEFHCEVVADGSRFEVKDLKLVTEGYAKRRIKEVPAEWLSKVKLEEEKYSTTYSYGSLGYTPGAYSDNVVKIDESEKAIINRILSGFSKRATCPTADEVQHQLVINTSYRTPYLYCKSRAEKFVKNWGKDKKHEKQAA